MLYNEFVLNLKSIQPDDVSERETKINSSADDQTIKLRNARLAIRELKERINFMYLVPELNYKSQIEEANRTFQKDQMSK